MNADADLLHAVDGRWLITGNLDFNTVPGLWRQVKHLLNCPEMVLSLAQVKGCNSAALVFLLEVIAEAARQGTRLRLEGVPERLYDIARMYNASHLLPPLEAA